MQEYQKKIYDLWGANDVPTFPFPSPESINLKSAYYKNVFIKRFFPTDKKISILDLGSGWGIFLKSCLDEGYENVYGVEVVEKFVNFTKEKFGIKGIAQGQIMEYLQVAKDESFDVICAFDVMEHISKNEIMDVLGLIYKKLKKNGKFIMQVPNGASLGGLYIFNSDITHEIAFTDYLIKELFQLAGFAGVEISKAPKPSSFKNMVVNLLRKVLAGLLGFDNPFMFTTDLITVAKK